MEGLEPEIHKIKDFNPNKESLVKKKTGKIKYDYDSI